MIQFDGIISTFTGMSTLVDNNNDDDDDDDDDDEDNAWPQCAAQKNIQKYMQIWSQNTVIMRPQWFLFLMPIGVHAS